jgi:steroid delta-isomerase-like uncharacterized protein
MTRNELADTYRRYIDCLNRQDWQQLGDFVGDDVTYNGTTVGLHGYRAMLEKDFQDIPDLAFHIQLLVSDPPTVASRLNFNVTPKGEFLGLPVNGKRVTFSENVFYTFVDAKIAHVWSVIDKAAVEQQLSTGAE